MPRAAVISPGGPGDRIWRPEQPSQLYGLPCFSWERFWVLFRPPYSISGASRADSSGSVHLREQGNPMGDSGSDAGASVHASFRHLHRAAAGSLRTIYKKRLFSSSRPSAQLFMDFTDTGSITSHTPLINPAPRVRVIHSHVVARAHRCDCAPRTQDDPTTVTSTRPGDHVRVNHAHPWCGIDQWSV